MGLKTALDENIEDGKELQWSELTILFDKQTKGVNEANLKFTYAKYVYLHIFFCSCLDFII